MNFFKVVKKDYVTSYVENIIFMAITSNGKFLFGTNVSVDRNKDISIGKWKEWRINYGTSGAKNYETALPYVECINEAMNFLKSKQ